METLWKVVETVLVLALGLILAIPGWYLICRLLDEVFDTKKFSGRK